MAVAVSRQAEMDMTASVASGLELLIRPFDFPLEKSKVRPSVSLGIRQLHCPTLRRYGWPESFACAGAYRHTVRC